MLLFRHRRRAPMRKRVVLLTRPYPRYQGDPYGAEVLYLAEEMAKQGEEVIIITTTASTVRGQGVKTHSFPLPRIKIVSFVLSYIWSLCLCLGYAWFGKMAVLNLQWAYPLGPIGLIIRYLSSSGLITTARGSDLTLYGNHPHWKGIIAQTLTASDGVITVGSGLRDIAVKMGVSHQDIAVIPSVGVDIKKFQEVKPIELVAEGVKLLYVGGLVPVKGLDVLIKACALLVEQGIKFHLFLVGKGSEKQKLSDLVISLKLQAFITFVGEIPHPQVPAYFKSIDVFVLPSRQEGLGIVLLEAMAAKTAIVASKVGGIPDLVTDGKNGLLVSPENPHALAMALTAVINDSELREGMAQKGLEVVKYYTYEKAAKDTLSFINLHSRPKR
jgi:glycosyltransferase involved in cell wall biosynthesis